MLHRLVSWAAKLVICWLYGLVGGVVLLALYYLLADRLGLPLDRSGYRAAALTGSLTGFLIGFVEVFPLKVDEV